LAACNIVRYWLLQRASVIVNNAYAVAEKAVLSRTALRPVPVRAA